MGLSEFTRGNLDAQGFDFLDDRAKKRVVWSLRFTPTVSIGLIAVGLALRSPAMLGTMAAVGAAGAVFPQWMPFDVAYNAGVRHLFHAQPLPPTPTPRRFSYGISAALLAGSAGAFAAGKPGVGLVLGGAVVLAGAVLATTLWCLGSWLYSLAFGIVTVR